MSDPKRTQTEADADVRQLLREGTESEHPDDAPLTGERRAAAIAKLSQMLDEGLADVAAGRVVDGPTAMARLRQRIIDRAPKNDRAV